MGHTAVEPPSHPVPSRVGEDVLRVYRVSVKEVRPWGETFVIVRVGVELEQQLWF